MFLFLIALFQGCVAPVTIATPVAKVECLTAEMEVTQVLNYQFSEPPVEMEAVWVPAVMIND